MSSKVVIRIQTFVQTEERFCKTACCNLYYLFAHNSVFMHVTSFGASYTTSSVVDRSIVIPMRQQFCVELYDLCYWQLVTMECDSRTTVSFDAEFAPSTDETRLIEDE